METPGTLLKSKNGRSVSWQSHLFFALLLRGNRALPGKAGRAASLDHGTGGCRAAVPAALLG